MNELQNIKQASLLNEMALKYQVDPKNLLESIKKTIMPSGGREVSNEEIMSFCMVANQHDLNPFLREIYAFPDKSGGIRPIVSIDGWLKVINRHPQLDGIDTVFDEACTVCTCTIWRKDRTRPVVASEYLDECRRPSEPWKQSPRRMLRHRAIIQCARIAFGISGISDENDIPVDSFVAEKQAATKPQIRVVSPKKEVKKEIKKDEELDLKENTREIRNCEKLEKMIAESGLDRGAVDSVLNKYKLDITSDDDAKAILHNFESLKLEVSNYKQS